MSHREAHRILAQELRLDRMSARRPADPSRRERKPCVTYSCPKCKKPYRKGWQLRIHVLLNACGVNR